MVQCGTVQVREPQADISIVGCDLTPPSGTVIEPSTNVEFTVSVRNNGQARGSRQITFIIGGQTFGTVSVSVAPNTTKSVTQSFVPSALGFEDRTFEIRAE
jgi:hypothetical protein